MSNVDVDTIDEISLDSLMVQVVGLSDFCISESQATAKEEEGGTMTCKSVDQTVVMILQNCSFQKFNMVYKRGKEAVTSKKPICKECKNVPDKPKAGSWTKGWMKSQIKCRFGFRGVPSTFPVLTHYKLCRKY